MTYFWLSNNDDSLIIGSQYWRSPSSRNQLCGQRRCFKERNWTIQRHGGRHVRLQHYCCSANDIQVGDQHLYPCQFKKICIADLLYNKHWFSWPDSNYCKDGNFNKRTELAPWLLSAKYVSWTYNSLTLWNLSF